MTARPPGGPDQAAARRTRASRVRTSRDGIGTLFAGATVLSMAVVVLLGFWPWFAGAPRALGSLLGGGPPAGASPATGPGTHPVVHLHGVVATGWLLLLAAQVSLVHRRKVALHRRLGVVGAGYGAILLLTALAVTVVAPTQAVLSGRDTLDQAAAFLLLPLGDMLLFAGFFGAALLHRRRSDLHRPLMILAAVALIFPGAARFAGDRGVPAVLLVWFLPLALAVAGEWWRHGRVPRVLAWGTALLLLVFARVLVMDSEAWLQVGRPLLRLFLPEGAG